MTNSQGFKRGQTKEGLVSKRKGGEGGDGANWEKKPPQQIKRTITGTPMTRGTTGHKKKDWT